MRNLSNSVKRNNEKNTVNSSAGVSASFNTFLIDLPAKVKFYWQMYSVNLDRVLFSHNLVFNSTESMERYLSCEFSRYMYISRMEQSD